MFPSSHQSNLAPFLSLAEQLQAQRQLDSQQSTTPPQLATKLLAVQPQPEPQPIIPTDPHSASEERYIIRIKRSQSQIATIRKRIAQLGEELKSMRQKQQKALFEMSLTRKDPIFDPLFIPFFGPSTIDPFGFHHLLDPKGPVYTSAFSHKNKKHTRLILPAILYPTPSELEIELERVNAEFMWYCHGLKPSR